MGTRSFLAALVLALPAAALAQNVAEVQVAPPSVTLKVGERSGLIATAFDRVGNVIPTVRVIWSSNNLQVAKVDNEGTVTGVANGVAIIEARVGQRKGQAAVQVVGGPAAPGPPQPTPSRGAPGQAAPSDALAGQPAGVGTASVLRIEPQTIYLLPSENTRVFPHALKEDGSPAAPVAVSWKSLREDIASVDQNGVVVALAPGQGTVQVVGPGGLTGTAPVVVQPAEIALLEPAPLTLSPGEVDTLHVIVPTQGGRSINPLALQWSTADPAVARVSLTGALTGVAPGRTTLSVSGLLQSKSVPVIVHKAVQALTFVPSAKTEIPVPIQGSVKFQVQAHAVDSSLVPEAPLRWSVGDTGVAGFDPATGVLVGKKVGKTQLVVRGPGQGLSVTWNVRVIAAGLKLSTVRIGLALGRRYAVKASFADETGVVIQPATGVAWASDNPAVAGVGEDGTITPVSYGHARVTATAPGGRRATVDVFVQGEIVVASSRSGHFQLYSAERSNLGQLRKIVPEDTSSASEPVFSPDGSRIAYVSNRDGTPEIYVMDADGSNAARFTNAPGRHGHPAFTPDGSALVFEAQRTAHPQIYLQQLTGSDAIPLTQEPASNSQPTVSPDGETIAFVSNRDGSDEIWLMSRDGTNQRVFTKSPQIRESAPHFLRDGALTYLVEGKDGGRTMSQVVKADLATGRVAPATGTEFAVSWFAINPVGDLLALVVNAQPGGKPIYRVYLSAAGQPAVPMPTTGTEQMVTPALLP